MDRSPKLITSPHESNTRVASLRQVITYRGIGDHVPSGTGDHLHWIAHLEKLARVLKPHDCAKWTVATYLPFLWRPEAHMYLKPEATKDYATRVGHPLASIYDPQLKSEVYLSLLDLADETSRELSDLAPLDRIDIQSFIWVVGDYEEAGEEA